MFSIPETTHSLINWRYSISEETVLNSGTTPGNSRASIAMELKQAINEIKIQAFASSNGKVDYSALSSSSAYEDYRQTTRHLQAFDSTMLKSRGEKLAFWINLYNTLVIDAVIAFGIKQSVNELPGFFWKAAYCINGNRFSTFDIEYGILRANAGHPGIPGPQFAGDDPRQQFSLDVLDPRLHFALVCASRSCPPIALYTDESIDQQLDLAAKSFINGGGVEIDREKKAVRLSKIFQWYAPDFGGPTLGLGNMRPVLDYITSYLNNEEDRVWLRDGDYKVRYTPYDWTLNL
jgi:hypothetical protein